MTPIPIQETYRGVGLHNFQDEARLQVVRAEIDTVIEMSDLVDLVAWAEDNAHAPESRMLSGEKALAIIREAGQGRQKKPFDPADIESTIAGLNSDVWRSPWVYGTLLESESSGPGHPGAVRRVTVCHEPPLPLQSDALRAEEVNEDVLAELRGRGADGCWLADLAQAFLAGGKPLAQLLGTPRPLPPPPQAPGERRLAQGSRQAFPDVLDCGDAERGSAGLQTLRIDQVAPGRSAPGRDAHRIYRSARRGPLSRPRCRRGNGSNEPHTPAPNPLGGSVT